MTWQPAHRIVNSMWRKHDYKLWAVLSTCIQSSSSGPDGIPVIDQWIEELEDNILDPINQSPKMIDSKYNIPSQWKHSIIVTIPKKGSSLSLDNQQGIAKSCAITKIQNKILLHRIKSVTESNQLGHRNRFHFGRSTTEQIMTLRFLLDAA